MAREVDAGDSPVNAIVSVLMLREGWDVQNVTVIVGLRPYTAKANILPEQTVGRGLRLMFRDAGDRLRRAGGRDRQQGFIEFVEQLERDEELELDNVRAGQGQARRSSRSQPDPAKADKDIAIPRLSPILARKKIAGRGDRRAGRAGVRVPAAARKKATTRRRKTFRYEGYDLITLEKLVEREYTMPDAADRRRR